MAQEYLKINEIVIKQPDEGLGYDFESSYTEDSTRTQDGVGHFTPMFTNESFSYSASDLNKAEMSQILKLVAKGNKFKLHYLSPYYGEWRDDWFYVGKGSISIGKWIESDERYTSLSFNMVGVNPI